MINEKAPAFQPLTGLYEPSAIQQLPDGRFLVVEDEESHPLRLVADRASDAFIDPEAIAATALGLTQQDRSAWSFEVDVRPFNEKW